MQVDPEFIALINPLEVGDFYQVPAFLWSSTNSTNTQSSEFKNPIRGAGCLRSSITDMVKYAQACIAGDQSIDASPSAPTCSADAYNFPPESPKTCLSASPTVVEVLGYAQQRQQAAGELDTYPLNAQVLENLIAIAESSNADSPGSAESPFSADAESPTSDVLDYSDYSASPGPAVFANELIGLGLHWSLFDQSETPAGGDVKYHDGGTLASSSVVVMHPELEVGMVLLSNYGGDNNFSPIDFTYAIEDFWRCGAAGDDCE